MNTHTESGIAIEALADAFLLTGRFELERLCEEVNGVVFSADKRLKQTGMSPKVGELVNGSFGYGFYEWEGRERWFGIQIYRPLILNETDRTKCRIGYWLYSEPGNGLRRRIYLSLSGLRSEPKGMDDGDDLFKNFFAGYAIVKISVNKDPDRVKIGRYVDITAKNSSEWIADRLVDLAQAFMTMRTRNL